MNVRALRIALLLSTATFAASPGPRPAPANEPILPSRDEPYPGTLTLSVDATDVQRRIVAVHEEVPVSGGKELILMYPRWLPGTHSPEGTIDRLAGLVVTAGSTRLPWMRDTAEVFAFHVPVPTGVNTVSVDFTYLSPVEPRSRPHGGLAAAAGGGLELGRSLPGGLLHPADSGGGHHPRAERLDIGHGPRSGIRRSRPDPLQANIGGNAG